MKEVFLGGTCAGSTWRDELIPMLNINYFNPVVKDWNDEAMKNELVKRKTCDFCLYVLTPKMSGVYSIAEVVDDSNKRPEKTLLCILGDDDEFSFTLEMIKSLNAVKRLVESNGIHCFYSLKDVADFLNDSKE